MRIDCTHFKVFVKLFQILLSGVNVNFVGILGTVFLARALEFFFVGLFLTE